MPNDEEAKRAIEALNGYVYFERPLFVSKARERQKNSTPLAE